MTALILSGCGSLDKRLVDAAVQKGVSEASVPLPARPTYCAETEAHAAMKEGDEIRSVLKRERAALDRQNARTRFCEGSEGFYAEVWKSY